MTEDLNAAKGDWLSDFSDDNNGEGSKSNSQFEKAEFLDLKQAGTLKIRLVGSFVKFRRHWNPYGQYVKSHDSLKDKDPAWKAGFYPSRRYAINVIDRADGKLKIMEAGPTVFDAFSVYKKATNINPAGKDGPDFAITIQIPTKDGKPDHLHKKYGVTSLVAAPFTDEEKAMFRKVDEEGNAVIGENGKPVSALWPLAKIFKPTNLEKVQELWDALPDEKKIAPKKDYGDDKGSVATKTTEAPITDNVAAPSNDLFEGNDTTDVAKPDEDSTDLF